MDNSPSSTHRSIGQVERAFLSAGFSETEAVALGNKFAFSAPRCLWLRAASSSEPIANYDLTLADPSKLQKAFKKIFTRYCIFTRFIIQAEGDSQQLLSVIDVITSAITSSHIDIFIITQSTHLSDKLNVYIYQSLESALSKIEATSKSRIKEFRITDQVTVWDIITKASNVFRGARKHTWDAIRITADERVRLDPLALCGLHAFFTSQCYQEGVLLDYKSLPGQIAKDINRYGIWNCVAIDRMPEAELNHFPPHGRLPLISFHVQDLEKIQGIYHNTFRGLLMEYPQWFFSLSNIPLHATPTAVVKKTSALQKILFATKELVENAAVHSKSTGYLMMDLDQDPSKGLYIYVGDMGIGLRSGLSQVYDRPFKSDLDALKNAFNLKASGLRKRYPLNSTLGSGGRGLDIVAQLVSDFSGRIVMISGKAICEFMPQQGRMPLRVNRTRQVDGLHVFIHIPTKSHA